MHKRIHDIVSSIVLAKPMSELANEFMVFIRGYLRRKPEDDRLFTKTEHAMRDIAEVTLLERDKDASCPYCNSKDMNFDSGNGGRETPNRDGVDHLYYTATCPKCGKTVYATYRFLGNLKKEEFQSIINPTENK